MPTLAPTITLTVEEQDALDWFQEECEHGHAMLKRSKGQWVVSAPRYGLLTYEPTSCRLAILHAYRLTLGS